MRKFEYTTGTYISEYKMNLLGAEGWEAVGPMIMGKGAKPPVILFKRELVPTAEEEYTRMFGHPDPRLPKTTQADEQPAATAEEQVAFHEALVTRGVWTAGWNIPGYLPDEPAETFSNWDEAAQYLDNELERAADDFIDADNEQTIVDQYAAARQLLDAGPGLSFHARIGNYVWWIERIIHPDES